MPDFWGVFMTPRNYEIVDCGAINEVIFFRISHNNLLGDFFDSLDIYSLFSASKKCLDLIFIYINPPGGLYQRFSAS